MSLMQRYAWFNLAVVILAGVTVAGLYPVMGSRAMGGFGFLGLLGLGPFLFRKKKGEIGSDERDDLISRQAMIVAYSVFWVVLVLVATLASVHYGDGGGVPVLLIQLTVWLGFMLVVGIQAAVTLFLYARGT